MAPDGSSFNSAASQGKNWPFGLGFAWPNEMIFCVDFFQQLRPSQAISLPRLLLLPRHHVPFLEPAETIWTQVSRKKLNRQSGDTALIFWVREGPKKARNIRSLKKLSALPASENSAS